MPSEVRRLCNSLAAALLLVSLPQPGLAQADITAILERLDRLERQNRELMEEVRALRTEIAAHRREPSATEPGQAEAATLAERLSVQESRVEEQAQTKVESGLKLPIRLTGMVLFNAFMNSAHSGTSEYPTTAALNPGPRSAGGMVRQSLIGFEFGGGQTLFGGKLSGSLHADFFAGSSSVLNHTFRIRTAAARLEWNRTTLMAGQDKPIFSPRDPTSLAQVGVSPMTNSGNPWLWLPQVSVEQRFDFGEDTELRARVGILQTNEGGATIPAAFAPTLERARPALEGRFELRHRNLELAPGFHWSTTHVAGTSVPSSAVSIDWSFAPVSKLQLTGLAFAGANIANLGTLRQGFTILGSGNAIPVRSRGGWAQLAVLPTSRLSFHLMAGQHDDNNSDLRFSGVSKNQTYGANVMYRIGPNLIVALEGSQVRTSYLPGPARRNNHYDLAFAYLF